MATKSFEGVIKGIAGANKEAAARYTANAKKRASAPNILNPGEVAGEYDANRLLTTTLGGVLRPITSDDLRQFKAQAQKLGKQYVGGITAKQIVDRALQIDRDRANKEIRVAIPTQAMVDKLHFMTNASAQSVDTKHHVLVQFKAFDAHVASPTTTKEAAKALVAAPIAFDCDCGRHTYWYRYLATVGRFNAGRAETGFPKIRNPRLVGVACKHVLRVVQQLSSPIVRPRIEAMVERARAGQGSKVVRTKAAEARTIAEMQGKQAGWKRNIVESSAERRHRLEQQNGVRKVAQKVAERQKAITKNPAAIQKEMSRLEQSVKRLQNMGAMTAAAAGSMLRRFLKLK